MLYPCHCQYWIKSKENTHPRLHGDAELLSGTIMKVGRGYKSREAVDGGHHGANRHVQSVVIGILPVNIIISFN